MDDMYNEPVPSTPPARAVQPQPINYETTPISEDLIQNSTPSDNNAQSLTLPDNNFQSLTLPDDDAQSSSIIPGGAITFIKRLPAFPPAQSQKTISQKVRTDPSYQMLAIASIIALLSCSVLAAFLVAGSLGANAPSHANQPLAKAHAPATTRSTQGDTAAPKPAPTLAPTQASPSATQQPTQSPSNPGGNPPPNPSGNIPVQFVNLPSQIPMPTNGSYPITVQTQPGLTVTLYFTYPGSGKDDTGGPANNSGLATIPVPNLGYTNTQPMPIVLEAIVNDGNGNMGQVQATVQFVVTP